MRFRIILFVFILSGIKVAAQDTLRVLFIGNSLTYYNNLPALVKREAADKGFKIATAMVAKANYAIIDHLEDGKIQQMIKSGDYNFVIVQQGPSSQPEGRKMLLEDGQRLAQHCTTNNTKLCFFMVWPSLNYYSTFDGVIASYRQAAAVNEAVLLPVGEAWKEYFEQTKKYDLYGPDGFHPSLKGSQFAAKIIVANLFK